jgi:hypothetical protein
LELPVARCRFKPDHAHDASLNALADEITRRKTVCG